MRKTKNMKTRKKRSLPDGFVSRETALEILGYTSIFSLFRLEKENRIKRYKLLGTPCYKRDEIESLLIPTLSKK